MKSCLYKPNQFYVAKVIDSMAPEGSTKKFLLFIDACCDVWFDENGLPALLDGGKNGDEAAAPETPMVCLAVSPGSGCSPTPLQRLSCTQETGNMTRAIPTPGWLDGTPDESVA